MKMRWLQQHITIETHFERNSIQSLLITHYSKNAFADLAGFEPVSWFIAQNLNHWAYFPYLKTENKTLNKPAGSV